MKRQFIIGFLVCLVMILCLDLIPNYPPEAEAANNKAFTLTRQFNGESNSVIVLRNAATGDLINATTGACSSSVAWDDAEIAGTQHAESNDWLFSIPSVSNTVKKCYFTKYSVGSASISKTTAPDDGNSYFLDLGTGVTYTATNPIVHGQLSSAVRSRSH